MLKNPIPPSALNSHQPQAQTPVPPLTLECHSQGFTGRDQVLVEEGSDTIMFYYDHHSGFGGWSSELKAGGPEGPIVCRAKKGWTSDFKVQLPDGREADCVKTGMMSVTHEFVSPTSGTRYKWKNVGIPGSGTELALADLTIPNEQRIVATWDERSTWSRKNGILRLSRDYMHELEVVCTTSLAMYALERARQGK
ncbi:uncharacterized protein JCM6883_002758 [Sporobolomyces salmoneus]|uniref:uncharacterized protein n=1 Tax=Sporobolomyces salmoneus TaxID=183962 RepID=UPI00317CA6F0